jgi:uncharacterized protein YjbI with pentapeptide repeats
MHAAFIDLLNACYEWAPGFWIALLIGIISAAVVIWFFRIQLRIRTSRTTSKFAWGRLALGVWICMWLVGLFLSWPWLNWHYAVVFFRYEVPHNIGLVVVPCLMAASGLTWLYYVVAVEKGSAKFWLKVLALFRWLCLKVLGAKHQTAYGHHMHWRFVLWGEVVKDNWQSRHLWRVLLRQRWLFVLLAAFATLALIWMLVSWLSGDEVKVTLSQALFPAAPHGSSNGAWSLFTAVALAPLAFLLWWFRDTNQLWLIENNRKDTNLKDFQKLCEWATGAQLVEDEVTIKKAGKSVETTTKRLKPPIQESAPNSPGRRDGSEALQVAAVHQLQAYLTGEFGQQFRQPTLVLLLSIWSRMQKNLIADPPVPLDGLQGESLLGAYESWRGAVYTRLGQSPLAQAVLLALLSQKGKALGDYRHHLPGCLLNGINIHLPGLDGLRLNDMNLSKMQLTLANLSLAQLQGTSLREAQLQGANLHWAQLQGAMLWDAQLQGANLHWAQLQGASLHRAQLQGANLSGTLLQDANLSWAQLQGARLHRAQLQSANLQMAQLQGAMLWDAQLQGADLQMAQLQSAQLQVAQLQGSDLYRAQLQSTDLRCAQFQGTKLTNVHLDAQTNFADAVSDSDTNLSVTRSELSNKAIPAATHALRLKARMLNHFNLPGSAYQEFQAEWNTLSTTEQQHIYYKAYDYAANPGEFEKDFPHLTPPD